MAKQRKDTILFLMEGLTDQRAMRLVLEELFGAQKVNIQITHGDICFRKGVNTGNVVVEVTFEISSFLANNSFLKGRILEIVHLIDTDGALDASTDNERFRMKRANAAKLAPLQKLRVPSQGWIRRIEARVAGD